MADRMMLVAQLLAASVGLLLAVSSGAQALADPTRPPFELMGVATTGAAPRSALQSILLSDTRKGAIIDGQYVPLGGTYGKAKLVQITATEVTLKSDRATEVLQLYPSVGKMPAAVGAGAKPEGSAKRP